MSLCLRCGWWGRRDDFLAHKAAEHRIDVDTGNEELPF
jgi:hypothetical protein